MNKNKIIFFCDYGLNIGLGHLIRTISIAEIFLEIDNFEILFLLEKSFHLPNMIKNFNCKFFEKLENIDKPFSYLLNLILEENPKVFFIDSEIWPNMINCISNKKIPITLLNGRISETTFNRWKNFPRFSKEIFSKLKLCFSSDSKSKSYLYKLGVKNIKTYGNLKFTQSENENVKIDLKIRNFLKMKKVWCASSTHYPEELLCANVHKKLVKKYKNLLTIIIPRHIERVQKIKSDLENLGLNVCIDSSIGKINRNTDIYIVNSYGKTKSFYNICKNVFLGGSTINHGGQNPLEAARYGCEILHGPHISNFTEIYKFLKVNNISSKIDDKNSMADKLIKLFSKKSRSVKIRSKINNIGKKVLIKTYNEIFLTFKNEI